jgi:hypothetical protein
MKFEMRSVYLLVLSGEQRSCFFFMFCSLLENRQTMLFSATQTRKIEDLARISLKKEPLYIGVDDSKDKATVEGLEQVNNTLVTLITLVILYNKAFLFIV